MKVAISAVFGKRGFFSGIDGQDVNGGSRSVWLLAGRTTGLLIETSVAGGHDGEGG